MKKFFAIVLGLVMALSLTTVASAAVVEFEGGFEIVGTYDTDWTWAFGENGDAENTICDIKFSQGFLDVATASLTLGLIVNPDGDGNGTADDPALDLEMKAADYTYIFSESFSLAAMYNKDCFEVYHVPYFDAGIKTEDTTMLKGAFTFEGGSAAVYTNLLPSGMKFAVSANYSAGALSIGGGVSSGAVTKIAVDASYKINDQFTLSGEYIDDPSVVAPDPQTRIAAKLAYAGDPITADAAVESIDTALALKVNAGFQATDTIKLEAGITYDIDGADLSGYKVKGTVQASDTLSVYAQYDTGAVTAGADLLLDGTNTLKFEYDVDNTILTVSLAIDF